MRVLTLVLVIALFAGCAAPAPPTQPESDRALPLVLERANEPRPEVAGGRLSLVWNFSAEWRPAVASGPLNVTLEVKLYQRNPAGSSSSTEAFRAGENRFLEPRTPFLGPGDYYYELTARREQDGSLVGRKLGMFETCQLKAAPPACLPQE